MAYVQQATAHHAESLKCWDNAILTDCKTASHVLTTFQTDLTQKIVVDLRNMVLSGVPLVSLMVRSLTMTTRLAFTRSRMLELQPGKLIPGCIRPHTLPCTDTKYLTSVHTRCMTCDVCVCARVRVCARLVSGTMHGRAHIPIHGMHTHVVLLEISCHFSQHMPSSCHAWCCSLQR